MYILILGDYMYYINYFFISSIIGFVLETICYSLFGWIGNSGYLFGPWTPVYGFGAIITIYIYDLIDKKFNINKFLKLLIFFIIISITLSIIELVGGYLIEFIFHETFWDYSNHRFNIGKYISLEMTFLWGISSIIFLYLARPIIDKFIHVFPKTITYIVTLLFLVDNIATIIIKLKLL